MPPSARLDPRLEEAIIALAVAVFVVGLGLSVLVVVVIYRRRVKKFQVRSCCCVLSHFVKRGQACRGRLLGTVERMGYEEGW